LKKNEHSTIETAIVAILDDIVGSEDRKLLSDTELRGNQSGKAAEKAAFRLAL
jgi:hypothetical protein